MPEAESAKGIKSLHIEDVNLIYEFVDPTMINQRGGTIIQFLNTNCAGATNLIGGIRIQVEDVRRVPAYIARYRSHIKLHALKFLRRHFLENNRYTGTTENFAPEDYGISFSAASLTPRGQTLNPAKRN